MIGAVAIAISLVFGLAPPKPGEPELVLTPKGDPVPVVADLNRSLEALDPSRPEEYFRLAESLASDPGDPQNLPLARRLAVLAYELARSGAGPGTATAPPPASGSAADEMGRRTCLLLASIASSPDERRWLRAIARVLDTDGAATDAGVPIVAAGAVPAPGTSFELASAIGLARSGEGRQAERLLEKPGVRELLDQIRPTLEAAGLPDLAYTLRRWIDNWSPACPECRNRRVVTRTEGGAARLLLCPTCHGNPGPVLTDEELGALLRIESALLSSEHRSWAAQVVVDAMTAGPVATGGNAAKPIGGNAAAGSDALGGAPLRDIDPSELALTYQADASKPLFRSGQWVEVPGKPTESGPAGDEPTPPPPTPSLP